ncbi:MAG: hypothetical protein PW792_17525 [Acidobacteriaceae bacterium]|nr:hypothetical protein [Acidobacteriaceae bacterium]
MTTMDVMSPRVERVRAFFAPVDRVAKTPAVFDPAQRGSFDLDAPPSPWIDLGWVRGFARSCSTKVDAIKTGAPLTTAMQVRSEVEATVRFSFESWGKLQLALSAGTQQMNLLRAASAVAMQRTGGAAVAATALDATSTATSLVLAGTSADGFSAGDLVAVDVDYAGATGYVGAGMNGAYLTTALTDVDYVRRVTLNVARVASVVGNVLTLETALPAGAPTAEMKASAVVGFCDREGSSFFQQWSAVFVAEGQQGERVVWHYPRLEAMSGVAEEASEDAGGFHALRLAAAFRALPAKDELDNETAVCWRSYVRSA